MQEWGDNIVILALFLCVLIGAILFGIPIAFSLLLSAIALMFYLNLFSVDILAQSLIKGVDSYPLIAIPFFMVAGETMSVGGLSQRIVKLAMACVGHRRGGIGYVAIFTAIILAGLSGSAVADAAALVSILYPMMHKAGYPPKHSLGLLASGGIIAPIIPPSLPLIIMGVAGNISITKLFLGGIAPGLMMTLALIATWAFLVRGQEITTHQKVSWPERLKALRESFWVLLLPLIIIGGIRFGVFTPTEAAVVAAVYAIIISAVVYRELTAKKFYRVLVHSARATAMVMFLIGSAMLPPGS